MCLKPNRSQNRVGHAVRRLTIVVDRQSFNPIANHTPHAENTSESAAFMTVTFRGYRETH
ncbi:hypothetical protein [Novipirellula galeiformis]|uniref:hypothetical protein n=1 Tax=Novipirellula galeiformis TaxID=2528004 RepID=UPI0011B43433|nr:hypothetical protein [Novipirellula galeiformis]